MGEGDDHINNELSTSNVQLPTLNVEVSVDSDAKVAVFYLI